MKPFLMIKIDHVHFRVRPPKPGYSVDWIDVSPTDSQSLRIMSLMKIPSKVTIARPTRFSVLSFATAFAVHSTPMLATMRDPAVEAHERLWDDTRKEAPNEGQVDPGNL